MSLDYEAVTQAFNDWASKYTHNSSGQWIAIDGKSLKNTVNDCYGKQQNFVYHGYPKGFNSFFKRGNLANMLAVSL